MDDTQLASAEDAAGAARSVPVCSCNEEALRFWELSGFDDQAIDQVCTTLDDRLSMRVEISDNAIRNVTVSRRVYNLQEGHAPGVMAFLEDVLRDWPERLPSGKLLIWLEDGMWYWEAGRSRRAPVLAFGRMRDDHYTLLIPDPAFTETKGYASDLDAAAAGLPWEDRKPTAFWRGATSGLGIGVEHAWPSTPRVVLTRTAAEIRDRDLVDALFTKNGLPPESGAAKEIERLQLLGTYVPFHEFLRYRYLIDADGHAAAWRSLFLKLSSGSLTMKLDSDQIEWYFDRLQPWKHYVPIRPTCEDLAERVLWAREHDEECRAMARAARELTRTVTYERAKRETGALIARLLNIQDRSRTKAGRPG